LPGSLVDRSDTHAEPLNSNSTGQNPDGALHQLDLLTAKVTIR